MLKYRPLLILVLLFFGLSTVSAQSAPRIIEFNSDLTAITPDQAESGTTQVTLHWRTQNVQPGEQIRIEVLVLDEWHEAVPGATFPADGTLTHAAPHTLSFAPPLFRLAIYDADGHLTDAKSLVIPYQVGDYEPQIVRFTSAVDAVRQSALQAGRVNVPVTWEVVNRPPDSNLVFEQVLDGSVTNIEAPRPFAWVRSHGDGSIYPALTSGDTIRLRLRLVDLADSTVYASQELTLPILRDVVTRPVATTAPPPSGPQVLSFQATPSSAFVGDPITLIWETRGAASVKIETWGWVGLTPPRTGLQSELYDLPPTGTQTIFMAGNLTAAYLIVDASRPGHEAPNVTLQLIPVDYRPDVRHYIISQGVGCPGDTVTLSWGIDTGFPVSIRSEVVVRTDNSIGV
ncbi:MAG: hypothetical protein KC547_08290, partial [Anaerolineae bacterium]|nr:hypothetical protein [Anaerolineae bacterium]